MGIYISENHDANNIRSAFPSGEVAVISPKYAWVKEFLKPSSSHTAFFGAEHLRAGFVGVGQGGSYLVFREVESDSIIVNVGGLGVAVDDFLVVLGFGKNGGGKYIPIADFRAIIDDCAVKTWGADAQSKIEKKIKKGISFKSRKYLLDDEDYLVIIEALKLYGTNIIEEVYRTKFSENSESIKRDAEKKLFSRNDGSFIRYFSSVEDAEMLTDSDSVTLHTEKEFLFNFFKHCVLLLGYSYSLHTTVFYNCLMEGDEKEVSSKSARSDANVMAHNFEGSRTETLFRRYVGYNANITFLRALKSLGQGRTFWKRLGMVSVSNITSEFSALNVEDMKRVISALSGYVVNAGASSLDSILTSSGTLHRTFSWNLADLLQRKGRDVKAVFSADMDNQGAANFALKFLEMTLASNGLKEEYETIKKYPYLSEMRLYGIFQDVSLLNGTVYNRKTTVEQNGFLSCGLDMLENAGVIFDKISNILTKSFKKEETKDGTDIEV